MNTGLTSWSGLADLGAVYPMVGTEGILVLIGVVYWIVWHIMMTRAESKKLREEAEKYRK